MQWRLGGYQEPAAAATSTFGIMASEREEFSLSGPLHLTVVDWKNAHHRRSVAASLVQGVRILERDRQVKRQGSQALAPPWWEFFHFQLIRQLVDDVDSSIFGAIYEFKPPESHYHNSVDESPRYVIAFRGTITKPESVSRDLELDVCIIRNGLHETSRFETAIQAVRNVVATVGKSNVWLAGHSLGAAMALLAGKTMAKTGIFLQAFLFNSPFISAPIERIKNKRVKHGLRIASSVITAGLALATKKSYQNSRSVDPFATLSAWVPLLFVNPGDHFCSEYIGYFEHRKKMDDIGIGAIGRLATQNSLGGLLMSATGRESEPLHLIPSANLIVNLTPCQDFREAHGIHQWWRPDLHIKSKLYNYK
ncbi:hypothetical protein POTOM_014075 [Populus tomentosa]|uniref:Fungal lipase-type domain-containing protein n=1 Tax=Populus tomentosa TaxID=118781 RepID=A0A8X8A607_POPTO|nr:hypothetical protein POTOM_014075 [Populus tomentosa]